MVTFSSEGSLDTYSSPPGDLTVASSSKSEASLGYSNRQVMSSLKLMFNWSKKRLQ